MSLVIIKAGICDTFQDEGRNGLQHQGINPGGAMDPAAARTANILAGNAKDAAVLEMHFPAPAILFEQSCLFVLAGADFAPEADGRPVPLSQPVWVAGGCTLQFRSRRSGSWCYLALQGGFPVDRWLGSYATHLKAGAGGWRGRRLQKNDRIPFGQQIAAMPGLPENATRVLPWRAVSWPDPAPPGETYIIEGPEAGRLNEESRRLMTESAFAILPASDRMGYALAGPSLATTTREPLVSSAVGFGTIQLLPDGQLIVLMADHQTTGGYPRMGQVVREHLPKLAQLQPGDRIRFRLVTLQEAQQLWLHRHSHLQQLECSARIKLESLKLPS